MAKYEAKSEVAGSVWKIVAHIGQELEPGDTILIVESMKMEIPVIAEDGGTLLELSIEEGKPVVEGQVVAILEA